MEFKIVERYYTVTKWSQLSKTKQFFKKIQ